MGKFISFYLENGSFITLQELVRRICRKIFSLLLSFRIRGARNLNVAPSSFIRGLSHIRIGKNFHAGEHLRLEAITSRRGRKYDPAILIKDNVVLNDFVHIGATNYIEIGNDVLMASKIFIADSDHGIYDGEGQTGPDIPPDERVVTSDKRVIIGDRVWIGESVSILAGASIGEGSVIGANSVVKGEIPPNALAVGSPARVVKRYDRSSGRWLAV